MSAVPFRCAVLVGALCAACGGAGGPSDAGGLGDAGPGVDAGVDGGVDAGSAFDAGPVLAGPLALSASFESADITRAGNVVFVHVQDANGVPAEGATVTLALTPPPPTPVPPAPAVIELGGGNYKAAAVDFTVGGEWDVTVTAVKGGLWASQTLTVPVP